MMFFLQTSPGSLIGVSVVLGLLVGSFLNVVIYRLPLMMKADWRRECQTFLQLPVDGIEQPFNLSLPHSHCPVCQAPVRAWQNIPVLSYVLLRGRCAHCGVAIALRYPLIEAFTGLVSGLVAWKFGYGWPLLFALILSWSLIALSFIDIDEQLLPDSITLPLLWLGLWLSVFEVYVDSQTSIVGAIAGYLSLWTVYQLFKLATGKEGMGYGDFKLLALLGAWLGWQALPLIIVLSSAVGAVYGISMLALKRHQSGQPMPFGPYLAAAGWLALLWGNDINHWYWLHMG